MGFSNLLDVSSFFIGVLVNLLLIAMICFYFKRKIDNLELSQSEQAKMLFQIIQNNSSSPPPINNGSTNYDSNVVSMKPNNDLLEGLNLNDLDSDDEDVDEENVNNDSIDVVRNDNENRESDFESDSDDDDDDDDEIDDDANDDAGDTEHDESDTDDNEEEPEIKMIELHDEPEPQEQETEPEIQIKKVDIDNGITIDESDIQKGETEQFQLEPELIHDEEEGEISMETGGNVNYEKYTIKELKNILESNGVQVQKKNIKKQELISMIMSSSENTIDVPQNIEVVESIEIPENDEIN